MRLTITDVAWNAGGRRIIDDISVVCPSGSVTGLLGPNGSGKTSLLNVAVGLQRPVHGSVYAGELNVHAMSTRVRARQLALLEQQVSTSLDLSVRDVVELGRIPHRGRWPARRGEGEQEIYMSMHRAGVSQFADRRWSTLSGGERQRVQLARALAQTPDVLMLDEPTNHLDLGHQIEFMSTVRQLGVTTIAALHDLDLAAAFCDQLVVLDRGRCVAAGPSDEVLTRELVSDVYGVDVTVGTHPDSGRLHVVWHGVRHHV